MIAKETPENNFKNIERLSKLMDSQFSIPGTNIRFGLDGLIGLVPGVGDMATFLVSGFMVSILAKNGASGFVLARMVLNILIDALIGTVPVIGDIFDVAFKANQKNLKLMREHYQEGRHKGGAWKLLFPLLLFVLIVIAGIAWLSYSIIKWIIHFF